MDKKLAAVAYALAVTRGELYTAIFNSLSIEDAQRVMDGTSFENIAAVLDCSRNDIEVDWNDFLTEEEKLQIKDNLEQVCRSS
jgi:hypothetical protein